MNTMIRWGVSCMVAVIMAAGVCVISLQQAEAGVFKQPVQYSQEEKKPAEPVKAAPIEEEDGCKC